nr:hypothetical protein [Tanacetum cinerariifolium]
DSPLLGVNTPRSDEDRLKLMELMVFLLQKGDVTRLQALVDKKKIVISEDIIRETLQLNDAEGVVCLPNEEIFAGLAQMGYEKPSTKLTFYKAFFFSKWKFLIHTILQSLSTKRTSWNEFNTAMASAMICLSKGQKFNFLKYIFVSLVRNVDSSSKFYMIGKGFLGVETSLFEGMLAIGQPAEEGLVANKVQVDVAVEENVAEDVAHDAILYPPPHSIPSPSQEPSSPPQQQQSSPQAPPQDAQFPTQLQQVLTVCFALSKHVENLKTDNAAQKLEIVQLKPRVKKLEMANKLKSSKLRRLRKVGASRRVEFSDDIEDEDDSEVQEVVEIVTTAKLITEVVTAAASQVSAASTTIPTTSATIPAAKPSIPAAAPTVVAAYIKRRKGVIIRDPEEELPLKTLAETPKVKDKGKGILVETPKPMKKKDHIEMDAEYARKLKEDIDRDHDSFDKDIDWDAGMNHVNQKSNNP